MMVAQQLYEGVSLGKASVGLITYMRTDSVRLAEVAIDEIRDYITNNLGAEYCSTKANHYSAKRMPRMLMKLFVRPACYVHRRKLLDI